MPTVKRSYRYRFYPNPEQAHQLAQTFGCTRFVYNWALNLRSKAYEFDKTKINYGMTSAKLTELKKAGGHDWLNDVSCVPPQQALRHLESAFGNFFKGRAKYPTFKRKDSKQSASYTRGAFRWKDGRLTLTRMKGALDIRWSRKLPSEPSSITVSRDVSGRYFVIMLCESEVEPLPVTPKTIGIDLGIKSVVVDSNGFDSGSPKFTRKYEKKLAKAQRRLSKKKLGSQNRKKEKLKVAKIHAKIADSRRDFTHKLTSKLINENQVISIESLKVKNMIRNPKLSKSIADSGWGELTRQLQYKADWYGRTIVAIDQWFPSSKLCSCCGYKLDELDLSVREWTCPKCSTQHDRDINAAMNIKAEGLSVLAFGENVSGAGLVSASRSQ